MISVVKMYSEYIIHLPAEEKGSYLRVESYGEIMWGRQARKRIVRNSKYHLFCICMRTGCTVFSCIRKCIPAGQARIILDFLRILESRKRWVVVCTNRQETVSCHANHIILFHTAMVVFTPLSSHPVRATTGCPT